MQSAGQLKRPGNLTRIGVIQFGASFDETGNLPTFLRFFVDEGIIEPQLFRNTEGECLGPTVDQLVCAVAGVAVDVFLPAHREQCGQIREAGLDGAHIGDIFARALQRLADIVQDSGIDIGEEVGIEGYEISQESELCNSV